MWFDREPSLAEFRHIFEEKIDDAFSGKSIDIVATEGGRITGECEMVRKPGEIGFLGLIVSKNSRRKGVGSSLLSGAAERCRYIGVSVIRAEISSGNKEAIRFLQDHGFVPDLSKERHDERLKRRIAILERRA